MRKLLKEFTAFMNQGNFLEIAIGLLVAASFKDLVTSFSDSFIMPLIAKILGSIQGSNAYFEILGMKFTYGAFISTVISFVIICFVLFLIVKAYNKRFHKQEVVTESELDILKDIRELLKKE